MRVAAEYTANATKGSSAQMARRGSRSLFISTPDVPFSLMGSVFKLLRREAGFAMAYVLVPGIGHSERHGIFAVWLSSLFGLVGVSFSCGFYTRTCELACETGLTATSLV